MLNGAVYSPEIILQSQPILATVCLNQYVTKKGACANKAFAADACKN